MRIRNSHGFASQADSHESDTLSHMPFTESINTVYVQKSSHATGSFLIDTAFGTDQQEKVFDIGALSNLLYNGNGITRFNLCQMVVQTCGGSAGEKPPSGGAEPKERVGRRANDGIPANDKLPRNPDSAPKPAMPPRHRWVFRR